MRITSLIPVFCKLHNRDVRVLINTRLPQEQGNDLHTQAEIGVARLLREETHVRYTDGCTFTVEISEHT
jgi:predicted NUDIX family phosphoesterase